MMAAGRQVESWWTWWNGGCSGRRKVEETVTKSTISFTKVVGNNLTITDSRTGASTTSKLNLARISFCYLSSQTLLTAIRISSQMTVFIKSIHP